MCLYSYLSCYSNGGSVAFITIVYFPPTLANGRLEELAGIFKLKIRHFYCLYPNIFSYSNNSKYLYKLIIFFNHDFQNSIGRIDKFRPGGEFLNDLRETLTYGKLLKHEFSQF